MLPNLWIHVTCVQHQRCPHDTWVPRSELISHSRSNSLIIGIPVDTQRNNNVIMTSKRRRFDIIITLLLRRVPTGIYPTGSARGMFSWPYHRNTCGKIVELIGNLQMAKYWEVSERTLNEAFFCSNMAKATCKFKQSKIIELIFPTTHEDIWHVFNKQFVTHTPPHPVENK